AHAEDPVTVGRAGRHMYDRCETRLLELYRVCDQVLEQLVELARVGAQLRQVSASNGGCRVLDCRAKVGYHLVDYLIAVDHLQLQGTRSNTRICQKVIDELLHASRAIDGETDELIGVRVELAFVSASQQLRIRRNHAQRFLKVVR